MGRREARCTVLRHRRRRRVRPADRRRRGLHVVVVMVDCAGHQPGDTT